MSDVNEELQATVANSLYRAGVPFVTDAEIGGLRVDFMVSMPGGDNVVIETKPWQPTTVNLERARAQGRSIVHATGARRALMVMPHVPPSAVPGDDRAAVVDATRVAEALGGDSNPALVFEDAASLELAAPPQPPGKPLVFAAMPFAPEYDDTFFAAMAPAADATNATCYRVDRDEFNGDIVQRITARIEACKAVIADLSDSNANVFFELGYARGLGKPTIHIVSTPFEDLPFDVRGWATLPYKKGQTTKLREPLTDRLREVLVTDGPRQPEAR